MPVTEQPDVKQPAPVITIYPDGELRVGGGYTVGDVLQALDMARRSILSVVLNPSKEQ